MAQTVAQFVAQRQPDWVRLETLVGQLGSKHLKLEQLSELERLYRRAAADLAYAQTFYPATQAHRFLNQLCARNHAVIYRRAPARAQALRKFFATDFPQAVRAELALVAVAAMVLALGALVGATAVVLAPESSALLVPEELRAVVARHQLWTDAALDGSTPTELATLVLTNNLKVVAAAFALGVTGIGTVFMLAYNGLHVGALLAHCFQAGLGLELLTFMAAHGWVELSVIALVGGAGLSLFDAWLRPGELPRGLSLSLRAQRAVKIVLGCAPVLAATGVVEGFVSPGALFPPVVKLVLGAGLGAAFWLYLLRAGRVAADGEVTRNGLSREA